MRNTRVIVDSHVSTGIQTVLLYYWHLNRSYTLPRFGYFHLNWSRGRVYIIVSLVLLYKILSLYICWVPNLHLWAI